MTRFYTCFARGRTPFFSKNRGRVFSKLGTLFLQKHAPLFWKNKGRDVGEFWEFIFGDLGSLYLGILSFGIFAGRGLFRSISLGFCTISARAAGGGGFYISDFFHFIFLQKCISYFCKNTHRISGKRGAQFCQKQDPCFFKNRCIVFGKTRPLFLEKHDPRFWDFSRAVRTGKAV